MARALLCVSCRSRISSGKCAEKKNVEDVRNHRVHLVNTQIEPLGSKGLSLHPDSIDSAITDQPYESVRAHAPSSSRSLDCAGGEELRATCSETESEVDGRAMSILSSYA